MSGTQRFPAPHRRASRLGSRTAQRWAGGFLLAALLFFSGTLVWAANVTRNQPKQARAAEIQPSMLRMPTTAPGRVAPVTTARAQRPPARKTLAPTPKRIKTRLPAPTRPKAPAPQRFANCTELRKMHPGGVPAGHPAYELRHDRDRDNWACENFGGPIKTSAAPSPTSARPASPSPDPEESPSPDAPEVPPVVGN